MKRIYVLYSIYIVCIVVIATIQIMLRKKDME